MRPDQPGHLPSLNNLRCPHEKKTSGPQLPTECTSKTDQSGGTCVFAGRKCNFVGFVKLRLIRFNEYATEEQH